MKVVSLFSGAGGLDLGLKMADHEIVWANDNFEDAVDTYRANIGKHIVLGDIREIRPDKIPDCDLIVGGFPCQGFSIANMTRSLDDSRNLLYREMKRIIRDKMPRFFLAENVKGILSLGKGHAIREVIQDFKQIGYQTKYKVVNAADYGVPQNRLRVLILGVRNDIDAKIELPPATTHCDPRHPELRNLPPWITVGNALRSIPEPDSSHKLHNHVCSKYKLRFNGYLGHRFIASDSPAPTVTARGDERGGVVVLHHPSNKRRMTVRELAAVQSFPLDFVFSGCMTNAYRQVANAVPPLLGRAIGKMFADAEIKEYADPDAQFALSRV